MRHIIPNHSCEDDQSKADLQIQHGDAHRLIKDVMDNSIDLIATDPPYEINFDNHIWDKPHGLDWQYLGEEFQRILKPTGTLIIFQGWSHVCRTKRILDEYFTLKNWIIYDRIKGRGAKTNLVSTREDILWYVMDKNNHAYTKIPSNIQKKTGGMGLKNGNTNRALSNIWTDIPPLVPWGKEKTDHPTQKPLALMNRIVEVFSYSGDFVFDPFMGSGTTGESCQKLNRRFLGFESDKDYYALSCKRLHVCV